MSKQSGKSNESKGKAEEVKGNHRFKIILANPQELIQEAMEYRSNPKTRRWDVGENEIKGFMNLTRRRAELNEEMLSGLVEGEEEYGERVLPTACTSYGPGTIRPMCLRYEVYYPTHSRACDPRPS
jgi:hypothetical protein